jgi:orotate phosphoribosyltransferase
MSEPHKGTRMNIDELGLLTIFQRTGGLLEGHFQLTSGLHSPRYLQCALVLQHPEHAEQAGKALAARFAESGIDAVVAPAVGGIIVAHETARAARARALFTEREAGVMTFRRGFRLKQGERVLVVEDVITTGGSTRETIDAVAAAGGVVIGAGSIVDRSGGRARVGVRQESLLTLEVPVYEPAECPLCEQGIPWIKPGSRKIEHNGLSLRTSAPSAVRNPTAEDAEGEERS